MTDGGMKKISEALHKKRQKTLYIYNMVAFLIGIENSCILVSIIFYIQFDVKAYNPKVCSSFAMAIFAVSSSLAGIFAGKYADKTRKVKKIVLISIFTAAFGYTIYTMDNIWLIFFGRFMSGCLGAITGILSAEISKCYDQDEVGDPLFKLQMCYIVGYILGPATANLFPFVNFSIGWWHVTPNNFIGLFMAFVLMITALLVQCIVTDISKEISKNPLIDQENDNKTQKSKYRLLTIWDLLRDFDLTLLLFMSGFVEYIGGSNELLINMIAIFTFRMDLKELGIIVTASVLVMTLTMNTILRKLFTRAENNVFTYSMCAFSISLATWCFVLPKLVTISSHTLRVIFIVLPLILTSITSLSNYVLSRQMLFRMVPENSTTFAEGIRLLFCKIFLISGYFGSGFVFSYLEYVAPCVVFFMMILQLLFFKKRFVYGNLYPTLEKYI